MDTPYSVLPGFEMIPGAKSCGVVLGGVCPKYKLSGGIVCENAKLPDKNTRMKVSSEVFMVKKILVNHFCTK
jgi:hypothetical protein